MCACAQPKGSAFAGDKEFFRFPVGVGAVIPAFDEAVAGMKVCVGVVVVGAASQRPGCGLDQSARLRGRVVFTPGPGLAAGSPLRVRR